MTLLAVVWAADTGAWFTGRRYGKTPLAPQVSPGKTWEGVAGGLAAATATGAAAAWWLDLSWADLLPAVVLASGASVVGDLYESMAKRRAGVKDSGRLLPGHGGILDRIGRSHRGRSRVRGGHGLVARGEGPAVPRLSGDAGHLPVTGFRSRFPPDFRSGARAGAATG